MELTVGKWGRVSSALDPAPISMFENVVNYKPEYILNKDGHRIRFRINKNKEFVLSNGEVFKPGSSNLEKFNTNLLIPDKTEGFSDNGDVTLNLPMTFGMRL